VVSVSFLIFGHRGYSSEYPENTTLAFRKAMEAGADGVELDIRASRDGKVVVIHDEDTLRVAGIPGKVAELDYADIRKAKVQNGLSIPLLDEVFESFPDDGFLNVEIKSPDAVAPLVKLMKTYEPSFQIVFSSFLFEPLEELRNALPEVKIGLLIGEGLVKYVSVSHTSVNTTSFEALLAGYLPYSLHLPMQLFNRLPVEGTVRFLQKVKASNIRLFWWTIDDIPVTEFLRDRSIIDGVITNQVGRMVRAYK
jgi:glycerophosphoryl diester phosphodiesterase